MKAAVLVSWYGPFPAWINAFLVSCSRVRTLDWIILHDTSPPLHRPPNVRFMEFPWPAFRRRLFERCGVETPELPNYKLCDAKVFGGVAFEELFAGYDYFGWGDLDIVFGNLDDFLKPVIGSPSVISFHRELLSNHLVLFRNTRDLRNLYQSVDGYAEKMKQPEYAALDDTHLTAVAKTLPDASFEEYFTTPFVNWMPWCDGTYNFPLSWKWNQGQLTNELDMGFEFPYFHFMVWKGGSRDYYAQTKTWSNLPSNLVSLDANASAFVISPSGIAPVKHGDPLAAKKIQLEGLPSYSIVRRLRVKKQRLLGLR